jgi:signal transduction histidine kinase
LLLTARETLIAGVASIVVAVVIAGLKGTNAEAAFISFLVVTTGLTALVSSIRDRNLKALELSQADLKQQVIETTAAREQAERSDMVKSAFLASMSHELRTPLNAIINFTRFVAKGAQGPVTDEQKETLNEVVDSARHLLNLINDVLDMSKIESGSLRLFVEDNVELKPIVDSVVSTGKTLVLEKPVEIQVDMNESLSVIRGDRQRIVQILLNIMSNACKFTETGSVKVRAYQEGSNVVFAITDTGPGIGEEDQKMVFEAFKQTTTGLRQGGGTGLGMPISKSLAEAHGGRLWLESKVGSGTTFYVALPIKSEALVPSLVA